MKKTHSKLIIGLIILLVLSVLAVIIFLLPTSDTTSESDAKKPLYWQSPMNPNYRSDKPGKSPMGMDLVPVYESSEDGVVKINSTIQNNIGVRTAIVKKHLIDQTIKTVGYIQPDDNLIESVNSYSSGWVRDLKVKTIGEYVQKNQLLFKLYAPDVISAQEEYLLAIKFKRESFIQAGKQKLLTLGMADNEIQKITTSMQSEQLIGVYAPVSGYVTDLLIKEGEHINPHIVLMTIADLSKVWVLAEVYEQDDQKVEIGQSVSITIPSSPNQVYKSKISYIYPQLNTRTRSVKVRIPIKNHQLKLKLNMYADVLIHSSSQESVVSIPKEALIRLGSTNRVVLALGDGKFKSIEVQTGIEDANWVQITKGLQLGDKVVTSAQFLIDSESNLKASLSRLDNANNAQESMSEKHSKVNELSDDDMDMSTMQPEIQTNHQHAE
jgi:Cu(I)/Ag(I) efflux system membrane fusion protein